MMLFSSEDARTAAMHVPRLATMAATTVQVGALVPVLGALVAVAVPDARETAIHVQEDYGV